MLSFRLPTSARTVALRAPAGSEELLLAEAATCDVQLAVTLLERIATPLDGSSLEWPSLPLADVDVAMVRLRQWLVGDLVRADARCPSAECAGQADLSFRLSEYLAHHAPRSVRGVQAGQLPGWYKSVELDAEFRPPSGADLSALAADGFTGDALALRCIRPYPLPPRDRRRIERWIEAMAPSLGGKLQARCPHCGLAFDVAFDPLRYVLTELKARALACYEEVHLLASVYHWSEREILALPQRRRSRYAALAAEWRVGA